jgi:transketolase
MGTYLRDVFSEELIVVGAEDKRIVVLDPDVARSTKMLAFRDAYPDRFFEFGVAEQNVIAAAAGMAAEGLVPFAVAFAIFITERPYEIIRCSVTHGRKNVKIIGGYAGFSASKDGATHICLEDLGALRVLPEIAIVSPADPVMTRKMIRPIIAHNGPVYMRIENEPLPVLYGDSIEFEIGKTYQPREGKHITLIGIGGCVGRALDAASRLAKKGIEADVLDAATLKPFDRKTLLTSISKTGRVVSIEDHNIYGGLASAVSEVLAEEKIAVPYKAVAMKEDYSESGLPDGLRKKYGTSTDHIVNAAMEVLGK